MIRPPSLFAKLLIYAKFAINLGICCFALDLHKSDGPIFNLSVYETIYV